MFKEKLAVAMIFLTLCGCSSGKQDLQISKVVRINLVDEPATLDPRRARDPHSQMLTRMFFEGLTRIGPGDTPQLALAESVEISQNLRVYRFTLRKAQWSNGDLVKASDFVYSWRKMLSPAFLADNAYQLYLLKNGKGAKEGRLPIDSIGVSAPDEQTLVVELEYPTPYFLELLAMPFFFPVCQKIDQINPLWADKEGTYVSNGPFSLGKWSHHSELIAIKNPLYWDAESVKIDGVAFLMVEGDTELKLFELKKLHWMGSPLSTISVDALPSLRKERKVFVKPRDETAFLRVNTAKNLLNHPKIRRALALAIERNALVEHVLQGGQVPATHLIPPSMQVGNSSSFPDGDLKGASALLLEALAELQAPKQALKELSLLYIQSERGHLIAQAIQQQWQAAFGVRIGLEAMERKVYFDRISKQDYDLAFCSWGADFHDPVNFLEVFKYKNQSTNNTNWEQEEYASLLNNSFTIGEGQERRALLCKCEQVLLDAMPIIPLFHYTMLYMKDEKLNGVFISSLGNLDFKWATLENGD